MKAVPLRQIDPVQINHEGPTSVNFRPLPKDNGSLSVDFGEELSPKASYDRAVINDMRSAGVMSICNDVLTSFNLSTVNAPETSPPLNVENPDHCLIDFPEAKGICKNISQRLKAAALWMYKP